jgi:hypothetical protein
MSLDWHLPCGEDTAKHHGKELPHEYFQYVDHAGEKCNWVEATCLVWTQLALQYDTANNPLNEDNFKEAHRRLAILNDLGWTNTWHVDGEKHSLKPTDLINLWGLWTNVSHKSKREWNDWLIKALSRQSGDTLSRFVRNHDDSELYADIPLWDAIKKIADAEATKPRFYDSRVRKDKTESAEGNDANG